ncbi:MAG: hypothetical protein B6U68_04575 [Candidatus Aenigmarchaeota archaeon ex4484_14]|nr:MAG: hypothetical protein B6U68_04575 [Candidatus Aenigmarchaeota archaeon ex4484_14]
MIEFIFPILIGILISYEDFKKSLIRNKYVLLLLIYALLFQLYFGIETMLFISTFLSSLIISFLFWYLGMWPAGDAKLFFALSLLFPPLFIFLGFAWLFTSILSLLKLPSNFFITIFAMFVAYEILRKFFTAKTETFFVLCAIVRLIIDYNNIYTIPFLYKFFTTLFVFIVLRFFV